MPLLLPNSADLDHRAICRERDRRADVVLATCLAGLTPGSDAHRRQSDRLRSDILANVVAEACAERRAYLAGLSRASEAA
jgi:hypothetical protein